MFTLNSQRRKVTTGPCLRIVRLLPIDVAKHVTGTLTLQNAFPCSTRSSVDACKKENKRGVLVGREARWKRYKSSTWNIYWQRGPTLPGGVFRGAPRRKACHRPLKIHPHTANHWFHLPHGCGLPALYSTDNSLRVLSQIPLINSVRLLEGVLEA